MKKYINLSTIMSLAYLLTSIFIAVLAVWFPQMLADEPTVLSGVFYGAHIGIAAFLLIDSVPADRRRRRLQVAKYHGSDEAFELVDYLLKDFADNSTQFKTAPEIMSVLYATFEEKRKEYTEENK